MEGNICNNQKFKEKNPELFDILTIKVIFLKKVENILQKLIGNLLLILT